MEDQKPKDKAPQEHKALHGGQSEVTWDSGQGRQPYANQGTEEIGAATGTSYEAGNRGALSGRTQEQLAKAKADPHGAPPGKESA